MRLLRPLKHPRFARFFAGQAVSQVGDFVFLVALPWQVLALTGDTMALGGVLTAYMAAQVSLLLAGGVVTDRFPRRAVLVTSDVLQGTVAATLAALSLSHLLQLWHLYALAAVAGASQAFAMPALGAFVPETVPRDDLQAANGLFQGTRTAAGILGPALGGLVLAFAGPASAFTVNAASFATSAFLLATVRPDPHAPPPPVRDTRSPLADVREGFAFVSRVPWLWVTILMFAFYNVAEATVRNVVLPAFVGLHLEGGPTAFGLVMSAHMAGALVGFTAPNVVPGFRRSGLLAYVSVLVVGGALLLTGFASTPMHVAGLAFVMGAAAALFALTWETSLMEHVPERLRGRVFSVDMLGSFGFLPLGMAGVGFLAADLGPRPVYWAAGALVLACSAVGLLVPAARAFGPIADEHGAGPDAVPVRTSLSSGRSP